MKRKTARKITALKRIFSVDLYSRHAYIRYYEKLKVDKKVILLESQLGTALGGNIAALLKTLCEEPEFAEYRMYVTVRKENRQKLMTQWSSFSGATTRITPVVWDSFEYYRILASAGYLINDNTFMPMFMKKEGQRYLNTWHGTPLKTLGKGIKGERFAIGNAQRNFLHADLLLYPNEHTKEVMLRDYMVENFGTGRVAMNGYPRNEVFFSDKVRSEVRRSFGFGDSQKIFAYLPTWRGIVGKVDKDAQKEILREICDKLDAEMEGDSLVYLKLHPMLRGSMELEGYKHLRTFPEDVPSYDFLQATDGLITDYSSIMFDYAVTGRKIVLFTYDEEEYVSTRGLTFSLDELPFPRVSTAEELAKELALPKNYDDSEFIKRFCPYDHVGAGKELLDGLLGDSLEQYPLIPSNGKKNIVLFGGNFVRNGIATALSNLINNLDAEKYNYLVLYKNSAMTNNKPGYHEPALDDIPDTMSTLGITNPHCGTMAELIRTKLWLKLQGKFPKLGYKIAKKDYENIGARDAYKTFGGARIDMVIQFNGYFIDVTEMFKMMSCRRAIFVHADMVGEKKKTASVPCKLTAEAYASYDDVVVVSEGLKECTAQFMRDGGCEPVEFKTAVNVIDYKKVIENSKRELQFDETTDGTVTLEELNQILNGDNSVFINIGRFSYEKGQTRLIEAFERAVTKALDGEDAVARETAEKAKLIILGSYGPEYDNVLKKATASKVSDKISLVRFLSNPYPLLKQCDYLVQSSFYEAFGLVLCEADILGVPCFTTKIAGPAPFMEKYGGMMVESSTEGIEQGIYDCLAGRVQKTLKVDYEQYNREAIEQFESLIIT